MNKDIERIKENINILKDCTLCPRNCHADRFGGQRGRCHETAEIVAARAALHMWEEPCISVFKVPLFAVSEPYDSRACFSRQ